MRGLFEAYVAYLVRHFKAERCSDSSDDNGSGSDKYNHAWHGLGLHLLQRFLLARTVQGDCLANERLESGLVNLFSFMDVNRAADISV